MMRFTVFVLWSKNVNFLNCDIVDSDQLWTRTVLLFRLLSYCSTDLGGTKPASIMLINSCKPSLKIVSVSLSAISSSTFERIIPLSNSIKSVQNLKLLLHIYPRVSSVFCTISSSSLLEVVMAEFKISIAKAKYDDPSTNAVLLLFCCMKLRIRSVPIFTLPMSSVLTSAAPVVSCLKIYFIMLTRGTW